MKPLIVSQNQPVIQTIQQHCKKHNITAAHFTIVGAVKHVELGFYDLASKTYLWKTFEENLEVLTITGNVALLEGSITIHAHGTFGRKNYSTIGGHVKEAVVSATCEVFLQPLAQLSRKYDDITGLNLIQ